jgi:hypothetical protein
MGMKIADGTYRVIASGAWEHTIETELVTDKTTGYWVAERGMMANSVTEENWQSCVSGLNPYVGMYVGVWTNPENGLVYVDRAYWVENLDVALAAAKGWNQKAIWAIEAGIEMFV